MAIKIGSFRDPYRPGAGPVVQPWIRPARRTLLLFRHYWPWMHLLTTCTLIVLVTLPMQKGPPSFLVTLVALACYVIAGLVFDWADRQASSSAWQQHLRGVRKLGALMAVTTVHWFLPAASTDLWLLYVIPMLTMGVDLERYWAFWLIVLTMLLLFLLAWPFTAHGVSVAHWSLSVQNGAIRALVGGYAGVMSYLLTHCLAYRSNTMREGLSRLLDMAAADRWLNAANTVATSISDLLSATDSVVHTNVLIYEPTQRQMTLIGSSTAEGQALAKTGFAFPAEQGITGWAAQQQKPCFINDTAYDPDQRFLANAAFPNIRSALAVPILLDNQRVAVLDIESPIANDVAYEDLELMNHVAHYLLAAYQRSRMLEFHQQLATLGTELANRIIQVEEIGAMLEKIAEVALNLLDADIIRFYYRHPESGQIEQRCTIGTLRMPGTEDSPVNDPQSLVNLLMEGGALQTFPDALHDPALTRKLRWHQQRQCEPFVVREGVQACAAMPLIVGQQKLGLMWVNYRRVQRFSPALRSSIQMLAPYAALAIKSGVQSALANRQRREQLRRDLHDALTARLRNAHFAMDRLEKMTPHTEQWKETLLLARLCVKWAMTVVTTLKGERATPTLHSVLADLQTLTELGGRIYAIPVHFQATAMPDRLVSQACGIELLFACEEAIQNALRHADASHIDIRVEYKETGLLYIEISDDGIGFSATQLTRVGGIENMRARIEQSLGGHFTLATQPGQGVKITYCIPLGKPKEAKDADFDDDPTEQAAARAAD